MIKVGIVMGSDSDMPVMKKTADTLKELGIEFEMSIISAHREPDLFFRYAKGAKERGLKVLIAGAGMAAICPECSPPSFRSRSLAFPCTRHPLGAGIPCIPSSRCLPAFRLRPLRSGAE